MNDQKNISLEIEGMSCHSCARTIQGALKAVPGVEDANVNFATNTAHVVCSGTVDNTKLLNAVAHAGYHARLKTPSHQHHHGENGSNAPYILLICFLLTLPFLLHMVSALFSSHLDLPPTVQLILGTAVQLIGGWGFYRSTFYSLRQGTIGMDSLIALGTTAAYAASVAAWIKGGGWPFYFETSATIITLVLFGRWLEARSKGKASEAIGKLAAIQPAEATVERNGMTTVIPVAEVVKGDFLRIKAGERVPVDGIVVSGQSEVDEAIVTGESVPKIVREGSRVLAGTLNIDGSLQVRAEGIGSETLLAGMVRMVERAQMSKPPVQRLADQISAIFVPAVLLVALVTFAVWMYSGSGLETALINAVAVLVIACPCALGLATPIVITVAGGRGAKAGILFKEASAIEQANKLSRIFFDKTGTLTEGKPSVTDIIPAQGISPDEVLRLAASLEAHVEHPLARAIVEEAKERGIKPTSVAEFKAIAGKGAEGIIGGANIGIGALSFAKHSGVDVDEKSVVSLEKQGKSLVAVWRGNKTLGYIGASDRLRDNAAEAIDRLKDLGIDSVMLTGDNPMTAGIIAGQAGITRFHAGLLPQEKLAAIHQAKEQGNTVGMIGDGINDAPALAAADVGFALGASTDVAMEAASIALMRNDLLSVADAVSLSKAAFVKIKQNLFFAFAYNVIGIPLAALGLLNPIIAAAAMAMSSLSVVLNALLLSRWKESP